MKEHDTYLLRVTDRINKLINSCEKEIYTITDAIDYCKMGNTLEKFVYTRIVICASLKHTLTIIEEESNK